MVDEPSPLPNARTMTQRIPATLITSGSASPPRSSKPRSAVIDALGATSDWDQQLAGLAGVKAAGDPLPDAALATSGARGWP